LLGSGFLGSKVQRLKELKGLEAIRLEGNKARTPESLKAESLIAFQPTSFMPDAC
jgi:hypothetical protein